MLNFTPTQNRLISINILSIVFQHVIAATETILKKKDGMNVANVFEKESNSDRLVSMFRIILSKKINQVEIKDLAVQMIQSTKALGTS